MPAEDQRIDLRREIHQVEDHRPGLFDQGQRLELRAHRLIQRGIEKTLLHHGQVCARPFVHAQPFVLKCARVTDQSDKGADGHSDAAQRQQRAQTPAPEILPSKTCEGELAGHDAGKSPQE